MHGAGTRSADLTPNGNEWGDEPHPEFWRSGTHLGVEPNHNSTTQWAQEGVLCFNLNAHGVDNGREVEYYAALDKTGRYSVQNGKGSRETSYFRGMCLRLAGAGDRRHRGPAAVER